MQLRQHVRAIRLGRTYELDEIAGARPSGCGRSPATQPAGAGLRREGFSVVDSQATYFLNLDLTASGIDQDDASFCRWAIREHGVAAIPVSVFYETAPVTNIVRLCFPKADATLDAGIERLAKARDQAVRNRAGVRP